MLCSAAAGQALSPPVPHLLPPQPRGLPEPLTLLPQLCLCRGSGWTPCWALISICLRPASVEGTCCTPQPVWAGSDQPLLLTADAKNAKGFTRKEIKGNLCFKNILKYCFLGINSFCQKSFSYSLVKSLLKMHLFWGSQVLICMHHDITFVVYKERDLHLALRSPAVWVSSLIIIFCTIYFVHVGRQRALLSLLQHQP